MNDTISSVLFDDIFSDDQDAPKSSKGQIAHDELGINIGQDHGLSEVARLRRLHYTNGYREGVSEAKESYVQAGFDEGYALGAELGIRAGALLGRLQALLNALRYSAEEGEEEEEEEEEGEEEGAIPTTITSQQDIVGSTKVSTTSIDLSAVANPSQLHDIHDNKPDHIQDWGRLGSLEDMMHIQAQAQEELNLQVLFGQPHFGRDGVWMYDLATLKYSGSTTSEKSDSAEATFRHVADSHPLIIKWTRLLDAVTIQLGINSQS